MITLGVAAVRLTPRTWRTVPLSSSDACGRDRCTAPLTPAESDVISRKGMECAARLAAVAEGLRGVPHPQTGRRVAHHGTDAGSDTSERAGVPASQYEGSGQRTPPLGGWSRVDGREQTCNGESVEAKLAREGARCVMAP